MSSQARAIVVGHGEFAPGLVSAVEHIMGKGDALMPLTTTNLAGAGIEELVRERVEATGVRIVFTDLPGGSATMAARRLQRSIPDLTIISGTNLPVLLEFVQQSNGGSRESAIAALERGKAAMQAYGGSGVG